MKITDALVVEHRTFYGLLDFVEESLPALNDVAQVQLLGRLIERLFHHHAEAEENTILPALDHVLEDKGERERFHQEHHEMDNRLKELHDLTDVAEARRSLESVIATSRKHFKHEEKSVFPLAEKVMAAETLVKLGSAVLEPYRRASH